MQVNFMGKEMKAKPWRFMILGGIGAGKTTLIRVLEGKDPDEVLKTQMIDYAGWGIDTPGEYSEMGNLRRTITATAFDADLLLVVQDATDTRPLFPPHYFLMFPQPTIGVISKIDLAEADVARAEVLLRQAGVTGPVFLTSAVTGQGISELRTYLLSRENHQRS
jgi:ethanolamine utilization protein EutP